MQGKNMIYIAFVAAEAVIFGLGNVLMKFAYAGITPLWCSALRFGLAFAVFVLFFGRKSLPQLRAAGVRTWLPTSLCMGLSYIAVALAVAWTSATNAAFFISLPMLFAPAISLVLLRRAYRISTMALQAAVMAGLYMLGCSGGLGIGAGEIAGLASSAFVAASMVLSERCSGDLDAMAVSTAQTGVTFGVALVGALVAEPLPAFAAMGAASWMAIAFLAVVGTCVAFFLQNAALAHIPSATVSVILCAEPVATAFISFFALGEVLSMMGAAGCAIIVACTVASSVLDGRPAAADASAAGAAPAAVGSAALAGMAPAVAGSAAASFAAADSAAGAVLPAPVRAASKPGVATAPRPALGPARVPAFSFAVAPRRAVSWVRYNFAPISYYERKDAA